ncbi:MAG: S8 family serine peptidase [Candidatus Thorarchaeota archaeon]|nr:S8 family serine peptidase [Candidatus Thorarchaeota archaeon]
MIDKKNMAVLLFACAMLFSMVMAPATPVARADLAESSPSLPDETKNELDQWYDTMKQPGYEAKLDSVLASWNEDGELSDKAVTDLDGNVDALLIAAPWADKALISDIVNIEWEADLRVMQAFKISISSAEVLDTLVQIDGVSYIEADQKKFALQNDLIKDLGSPDESKPKAGLDMYKIREVIGAETAPATGYTGDGINVGHVDTGADFGQPDLQHAYGGAYDPTGYGLVPTFYHANSTNVNETEWDADPYALYTYEDADGNVFLDVDGWDPITNYQGGGRYLIGDGNSTTPYVNRVGFIWLYAYFWGIDGAENFKKYMWKDWHLPDPSNLAEPGLNYSVGWVMQQRYSPYAKMFAPSLVWNGTDNEYHMAINWEDTMGWNKLWTGAFYYETYDLTDAFDIVDIANTFDFNFTDDIVDDGDVFDMTNPIVAHDYDGDGIDDFSLGALCYEYDAGGWFADEPYFHGFRSDGDAFALYYDEGTHGTATAAHVAGGGNYTYNQTQEDGETFTMEGIAPDAQLWSTRTIVSGASDFGSYLWTCGFDLNATSGEWYYTGNHKSDLVTNSWGWITPPSSEFNYLSITWTVLSVPDFIETGYPGTLHVFSAGNEGSGFMTGGPPGSSPAVLTVGASTTSHWLDYLYGPDQDIESIASFTSKGPATSGYPKPDVLAPGLAGYSATPWYAPYMEMFWQPSIWGTGGGSWLNYTLFSGTSQAAPVAAGAAALVLEAMDVNAMPGSGPADAKIVLQSTAKDMGYDPATQGFGRIDVEAACNYVEGNSGYVTWNEDSFNNIAGLLDDPWSYWGHIGIGADVNETATDHPRDFWDGSIFFGHVFPGTSTTVHQWISDDTSIVTTPSGANAYYMREAETYTFEDTTWWYTDPVSDDIAYGYHNLNGSISGADYVSATETYNYATVGVAFDDAAMNNTFGYPWMFLYDWNDNDPNDGMPNLYNETTGEGNELTRITSASDPSSTNMMPVATDAASFADDALFEGNMTLVIHDPLFDANATAVGNDFTCTVTFWETVAASEISFTDDASDTYTYNITLDVPADAETGIHQGFIVFDDGNLRVPFSYNVIANLTGDAGEEHVIVDGYGTELEPYDSAMYGCMGSDPDDWDFRAYHIHNQHATATYLGIRVIWEDMGNSMTMSLLDDRGVEIASSADGTATTTAMLAALDSSPTGHYFLVVHPTALNGTVQLPVEYNITTMWYEELTTKNVSLSYNANNLDDPVVLADGPTVIEDEITGDHAVINATYPDFNLPNMPEYEITQTSVQFLSGLYYYEDGIPLVIPPSGYDPFSGAINLDAFSWQFVEGVKEGDTVDMVGDFTNGDCDFMVWWADTDNGSWTYDNNLMGADMATGDHPEIGQFVADRGGTLAIGCFDYDGQPGTWSIEVDTRVGITETAAGQGVTYDTYQFYKNGEFDVKLTAETDTNIGFSINYGAMTFTNFFAPVLSNLDVSTSGTEHTITWDVSDTNAGDEHYFEVLVSADGGTTYQLLAKELNETEYVWDSDGFTEGDDYMIQVRVYDNDPTAPASARAGAQFWPGLYDDIESSTFTAGNVAPPTTTTTTTTTPPPPPPPPIDPLILGLVAGIGAGVVVVLILFLVKRR